MGTSGIRLTALTLTLGKISTYITINIVFKEVLIHFSSLPCEQKYTHITEQTQPQTWGNVAPSPEPFAHICMYRIYYLYGLNE